MHVFWGIVFPSLVGFAALMFGCAWALTRIVTRRQARERLLRSFSGYGVTRFHADTCMWHVVPSRTCPTVDHGCRPLWGTPVGAASERLGIFAVAQVEGLAVYRLPKLVAGRNRVHTGFQLVTRLSYGQADPTRSIPPDTARSVTFVTQGRHGCMLVVAFRDHLAFYSTTTWACESLWALSTLGIAGSGTQLVVFTDQHTLDVLHWCDGSDTWRIVPGFSFSSHAVRHMTWLPDGQHVAVLMQSGYVQFFSVPRGRFVGVSFASSMVPWPTGVVASDVGLVVWDSYRVGMWLRAPYTVCDMGLPPTHWVFSVPGLGLILVGANGTPDLAVTQARWESMRLPTSRRRWLQVTSSMA